MPKKKNRHDTYTIMFTKHFNSFPTKDISFYLGLTEVKCSRISRKRIRSSFRPLGFFHADQIFQHFFPYLDRRKLGFLNFSVGYTPRPKCMPIFMTPGLLGGLRILNRE